MGEKSAFAILYCTSGERKKRKEEKLEGKNVVEGQESRRKDTLALDLRHCRQ